MLQYFILIRSIFAIFVRDVNNSEKISSLESLSKLFFTSVWFLQIYIFLYRIARYFLNESLFWKIANNIICKNAF